MLFFILTSWARYIIALIFLIIILYLRQKILVHSFYEKKGDMIQNK